MSTNKAIFLAATFAVLLHLSSAVPIEINDGLQTDFPTGFSRFKKDNFPVYIFPLEQLTEFEPEDKERDSSIPSDPDSDGPGDFEDVFVSDTENRVLSDQQEELFSELDEGHFENVEEAKSRPKRQSSSAMDLSLSHTDRNGNPRPAGRIFGSLNGAGFYNNRRNNHFGYEAGIGSVLYRKGGHSLGVGVSGTGYRGTWNGYRYRSPRTLNNIGVGLGYRYKF